MQNLIQTPFLVFTNVVYIGLLFLYLRKVLRTGYIAKGKVRFTIALIFGFCMTSFWGADWFGYLQYYEWTKAGFAEHVPMERFYVWLMEDVCTHYLQFRAIVWGVSLILFIQTVKRLKINIGITLFFFCSIYLIYFSYARATLAIAMMTYGYALLWSNAKRHTIHVLLGLAFIVGSFYFHKSSIIGITAILASVIVNNLGRKGVAWVIALYPIAIFGMIVFINYYLGGIAETEDTTLGEYAQAGTAYMEAQQRDSGIGTFIQRVFFERLPYYLLAYASYKVLSGRVVHSKMMKAFMTLLIVEIATATLFIFDLGVNTDTLYTRSIRFAQIPACMVLTYLYQNGLQRRLVKYAYTIGIVGCAYSLIYTLYNQFN